MDQYQKAFQTLREVLMKSPILVYSDPNKPHIVILEASKYAWCTVLTQEYATVIDGKV